MTNPFVEANLPGNSGLRVAEVLERYQQAVEAKFGVPWEPPSGDQGVILAEILSSLGSDVELEAATVLSAVFRRFGTKLFGTPYNEGAQATGSTTWTLAPEEGKYPPRTIPAGTQLEAGGLGFYTSETITVAEGDSTVTVPITAVSRGPEYNGASGAAVLLEPFTWAGEITIVGETTGGAEQETDEEYEGRLTAELELQAPRPITASDFAQMTLGVPSSILPTGVVVGRATAIDGYNPGTTSLTATTSNKSTTLSEVSSYTGLTVGSILSGTGIPSGSTVASVNTSAKTLVMSAEATSSNSKETVSSIGSYENERCVTVWVADDEGKALTSEAMEAIEAWLKTYREVNFQVFVRAPVYQTVYVTYSIVPLPGYNHETLLAQADGAIEKALSPWLWGNPNRAVNTAGKSEWLSTGYEKVRYNALLGVIEAVKGVQYVPHGSSGLEIGFTSSPTGVEDLTLTGGPVVLPEVSSATIKGTA